jgi:carboxyl-terminal processing protease
MDTIAAVDRVEILSRTYGAVRLHFSHWQGVPDLDLEAAYRGALERALEAEGRYQFALVMMEFLACLRNGHTWYTDPWVTANRGSPLGLRMVPGDGGWMVRHSRLAGVPVGAEVVSIGGEETGSFFATRKHLVPASSDRQARLRFHWLRHALPATISLVLGSGEEVIVEGDAVAGGTPGFEARRLRRGDVGYLRIPSFGDARFEELAIEALTRFSDSPGLIVDVRGNEGGATPERLISRLMDRPYRSWAESTSMHLGIFSALSEMAADPGLDLDPGQRAALEPYRLLSGARVEWGPVENPPPPERFAGRLVILTDSWTGSAAEDFVLPFKDNGRATVVGELSMGTTGQPYPLSFRHGMTSYVGAKRACFPDGSPFEGIGIQPDLVVTPSADDLRAGRDPVLDVALGLM